MIEEAERIIDEEDKVKHSKISTDIEELLDKESVLQKLETKYKMKSDFIDLCYTPII